MSKQRTVNPSSRVQSDGGHEEAAETEEEEETKTFLFQYLSRRAQRDKDIPTSDAEVIQEHGEKAAHSCHTEGGSQAVTVASRLADIGEYSVGTCVVRQLIRM